MINIKNVALTEEKIYEGKKIDAEISRIAYHKARTCVTPNRYLASFFNIYKFDKFILYREKIKLLF